MLGQKLQLISATSYTSIVSFPQLSPLNSRLSKTIVSRALSDSNNMKLKENARRPSGNSLNEKKYMAQQQVCQ